MIENGLIDVNSTHKIMITGAGRWRQGANACVFNPAVSCGNEPPLPGHISRVINVVPGVENKDVKYETFIKDNYPNLVANGSVSVYTKMCSPKFVNSDSILMPGFPRSQGACNNIVTNNSQSQNQINLVTPLQGENLSEKFRGYRGEVPSSEIFKFLHPVFAAALELVSDNKSWLINMDMHGGNILTNPKTGLGMMSDWDQSLIIVPNGNLQEQINSQIPDDTPCLAEAGSLFEMTYPQWWA